MKEKIKRLIINYVKNYSNKNNIQTKWKEPIIKFANADDKDFHKLKKIVTPTHALPKDFLKNAKTVVAYFLPFEEKIAKSNIDGKFCSEKWAKAYLETNQLISKLNRYIKSELEKKNFKASLIPATHNFDEKTLKSDWSHRHVANIAGLGTFGINNMLITEKGCCGRIGSIITDIEIVSSEKIKQENCLYKYNSSCKKCIDNCNIKSLKDNNFDRFKCYDFLLENDKFHTNLGLIDACGKCCVNLPCSFVNPLDKLKK
ncbi:MAG: epoxyqueuosine reductase [Bacillota bacterium]